MGDTKWIGISNRKLETLLSRPAEKYLSTVLFGYMIAVILLITLSPFRFSLPGQKVKFVLYGGLPDLVMNIFLFIPAGALYQLRRGEEVTSSTRGSRRALSALLFGLGFSLGIELAQLFLEKRYTAITDVLTNGLGAWMGAWGMITVSNRLPRLSRLGLDRFLINHPVFILPYLVLPLLWLNGMATGEQSGRVWFMVFVAVPCALLAADFARKLGSLRRPWGAGVGFLILTVWFTGGAIQQWIAHPRETAVVFGLAGAVFARCGRFRLPAGESGDLPRLRIVFVLFLPYLVLLNFFPFGKFSLLWDFRFGISGFPENPPNEVIFRLLEYLGVVSLFGYMVSQLLDHRESSSLVQKIGVAGWILGVAGTLELLRGFHGDFEASLLRFLFAAVAGFAGELIYRLQIGALRRFRLRQIGSPSTLPRYVR